MTQARISAALRREVRERARERCEYCLLAELQTFFPHEPDHLIALKHGGRTVSANLALACFDCNRFKGSDIASLDPVSAELVALFNPRTQKWEIIYLTNHGSRRIFTAWKRRKPYSQQSFTFPILTTARTT